MSVVSADSRNNFVLLQHALFTCVHKHYSVSEWVEFARLYPEAVDAVAVSSGSGEEDYIKLKEIVQSVPKLKYICLDVANGYSEHFVSFVRRTRKDFPEHTILVSLAILILNILYYCTDQVGRQCGNWRNGRGTVIEWSRHY